MAVTDERRRAWEDVTAWPLVASAAVFLAAYAWPILDPTLSARWVAICGVVVLVVWVVFAVDYVVRLALAERRGKFVRDNLVDLASVGLPLLRPLQLLRLVRALRILDRKLGESLHGRVGYYLVAASSLAVVIASLAVLDAERDAPGANITSIGDAVWWAFTTMTTVGYGDQYPVTTVGRCIAVGLMVFGVGLLGSVTASLASLLLERVAEEDEADRTATRRDIEQLTQQTALLTAELQRLHLRLDDRGGPS